MKITLSLLSFLLLTEASVHAAKTPPRVIDLGEIRIQGDVERPTVSFVIPRAQLDFLGTKGFIEKKKWMSGITESVKSDIFKVR